MRDMVQQNCASLMCGKEYAAEEVAEAARSGRLLSMELELSRACNLHCIYCYAEAGLSAPDELTLEEILDAVKQGHELGARKIVVLGGGEPLLYPNLNAVLDRIAEFGMKAELFTNATLIDDAIARSLASRNVKVVVKRNSLRRDVQDQLAGVEGAFDDIQRGIEALRRAGYPSRELQLGVETIVCKQNIEEIPEIWRLARAECVFPYVEMMTMQGRAKEYGSLAVELEEVRALFVELARIDAEEFGIEWKPIPPLAASSCSRHLYSCTVNYRGDVLPCPGVEVVCGNIRNAPLAQIISQSPVIRDLRSIYEKILGPCRECEHNGECYGCRGNAFQVTGDYLASDPSCWLCNGHSKPEKK